MSYNYIKQKAQKKAEKYGRNATTEDIENVQENLGKMNKGRIAKIWDKVVTLWEAFKSPKTPKTLKVIIIGGLIYLVSPYDIIPDFFPGGFIDDASVIAVIFRQFLRLTTAVIVSGATAKLYHLHVREIQKELLKKELKYAIIKSIRQGEEKYYVNMGLYDSCDNEEFEEIFEATELDNEIQEGMKIYA